MPITSPRRLSRACRTRSDACSPRRIVEEVTNSGLRGRGGAGFPDRHQVEDGSQDASRPEIHRLQRRRRRQRHLRRPHDHGRRSVRADRGHDHRRIRGGRHQRLHLLPLRISARVPHDEARHRHRLRKGLPGRQRRGQRQAASIWKFAWARAPISAAKKLRCSKAWKASAARSAPSRLCRPSRACSASRPWSTTSSRWPLCPIILDKGAEYYTTSAWASRAAR